MSKTLILDTLRAHLKVRLQSLVPGAEVLVDQEVNKAELGLQGKGFRPSSTESIKSKSAVRFCAKSAPQKNTCTR